MSFFGRNISLLRKIFGYQQAEMPEFTGVSRGRWSEYERSNTEPDFDTLIKIAEFFGVSIDTLLTHDISTDAHLINKFEERKNMKSAHRSAYPIAHLKPNYLENLILHDSGGKDGGSVLNNLMKEMAEMREELNKIKGGKK